MIHVSKWCTTNNSHYKGKLSANDRIKAIREQWGMDTASQLEFWKDLYSNGDPETKIQLSKENVKNRIKISNDENERLYELKSQFYNNKTNTLFYMLKRTLVITYNKVVELVINSRLLNNVMQNYIEGPFKYAVLPVRSYEYDNLKCREYLIKNMKNLGCTHLGYCICNRQKVYRG